MAFSMAFSSAAVPRLDDQRAGVGRGDRADLADGRGRAVVFDRDAVEHLRVGAAGADSAEVGCENLQGLFHFALKVP